MKQFVRKVKDNVLLFSEGERLVRDATSNEPWGASSTLMHQIADLTCQREHYESVTNMLWKRLTDVTYPRHVLKACLLVEFLLRNGSERFVHDMKQRRRRFEALSKFTDYAENPEIGADVRSKTLQLLTLLDDDAKRNEERVTAARTKAKIHGMGNTFNSPHLQSSGSQRRDDLSSNSRDNGFQESPASNRDNHNRQNSDDSFDEKLKAGKTESKPKSKEKKKAEKQHDSFGFDDDPLDDEDVPKPRENAKSNKKETDETEQSSPLSEKKNKKSKDSESKPKKDKKKKKKANKDVDSDEVGIPDPPSGQEDEGDFVGADRASGLANQMSQMSFEASFDLMDNSSNQKAQKQPKQPKQQQQTQQQQQPASFDFFSSLDNQTISPTSATQSEWFDSKPTAKTPEISNANGNAFFDDFQSASTIPAKASPNQSPAQTAKKPEDLWSSLTNIDSLTAPKSQQPVLSKTVSAPMAPQPMGQQQPYDAFSMLGANSNQGLYNSNNQAAFNSNNQPAFNSNNQPAFNSNNGFYNGYPQAPQQQGPYGGPYGQTPPQQPMYPMMPNNPHQQQFVNPMQQSNFGGAQIPMQQQKPQANLNIPDAFAVFGAMNKRTTVGP